MTCQVGVLLTYARSIVHRVQSSNTDHPAPVLLPACPSRSLPAHHNLAELHSLTPRPRGCKLLRQQRPLCGLHLRPYLGHPAAVLLGPDAGSSSRRPGFLQQACRIHERQNQVLQVDFYLTSTTKMSKGAEMFVDNGKIILIVAVVLAAVMVVSLIITAALSFANRSTLRGEGMQVVLPVHQAPKQVVMMMSNGHTGGQSVMAKPISY